MQGLCSCRVYATATPKERARPNGAENTEQWLSATAKRLPRGGGGGRGINKGLLCFHKCCIYMKSLRETVSKSWKGWDKWWMLDTPNTEKKLDPTLSLKEKTLKPFRVEDCDTDGKSLKQMEWNGIWKMTTIRNGTGKETHQQSGLSTEEAADRESIWIRSSAQPTVLKHRELRQLLKQPESRRIVCVLTFLETQRRKWRKPTLSEDSLFNLRQ